MIFYILRVNEFFFNDCEAISEIKNNCVNAAQISKVTFYGSSTPDIFESILLNFNNVEELVLNDFEEEAWQDDYQFTIKPFKKELKRFSFVENEDEDSECYNQPNDVSVFFKLFKDYFISSIESIWFEPYCSHVMLSSFVSFIEHFKNLKRLRVTIILWDFSTTIPSHTNLPPNIKEIHLNCAHKSIAQFLLAYFNNPNLTVWCSDADNYGHVENEEMEHVTTDEIINQLINDKDRGEELRCLINESRYLGSLNELK